MEEVYIVSASVLSEDVSENNILGVFTDHVTAFSLAESEIKKKYEKDLKEMYDNDRKVLEFKETTLGYEYHSNLDYYEVSVEVVGRKLNREDYHLTEMG